VLGDAYRNACDDLRCRFFDSGTVISTSNLDGVHLGAGQHLVLGRALSQIVEPFLTRT